MNITDGEVNGSENPNIWVYCQYLKKNICAFRQIPNKYSDFDKIRLGRGHHMVES